MKKIPRIDIVEGWKINTNIRDKIRLNRSEKNCDKNTKEFELQGRVFLGQRDRFWMKVNNKQWFDIIVIQHHIILYLLAIF